MRWFRDRRLQSGRVPGGAWQRLAALWRAGFGVYAAQDRDSAEMRVRHLHSVNQVIPLLVGANLATGLLLVLAYAGSVAGAERLGFLGLLGVHAAVALRSWWRQRGGVPVRAGMRVVRRHLWGAALAAALWAWPLAGWFAQGDAQQRLLSVGVALGMMCGGAFALAVLPQAALLHVVLLALAQGVALELAGGPLHRVMQALLVVYITVLAWCVLATARSFDARLRSEREAARQGQLVGLLLRDFEEHAADLLWEVGRDGILSHVSPRLAQALGAEVARLQTLTLSQALALSAPDPADGDDAATAGLGRHAAALRGALAQGRAFRDLELPMRIDGQLRWWSLTAKPLLDDDGRHAGWRGVISDVTEARAAHHQLARLAHFDALTGLANRVQLRERLAEVLELRDGTLAGAPPASARGRSALVCLDIDHFKGINDSLGHAGGDAVLVVVAQRLRAGLRWGDLAARLGGDEFALLVDDIGSDDELHALARRLTGALNQPCEVLGQQLPIGASLGIAIVPDAPASLDEWMAQADLALYAAKQGGRARYEVFVPRLGDRHRRRVALEKGLRGALVNGEMHLQWQPRIAIEGWRIVGAEALLRWDHPELGTVGPDEFIGVAESSGLIDTIGTWVLAQACTEAAQMPEPLVASINVSAAQLKREDFARTVLWALEASGLAPARLELEITESLFIDEAIASQALGHLHALRARGVRVAMDDFGTGYSSLAYLRRFPFDTLKIDRAFVRELMTRHDARAIVRTIIELARTLGMHTLAEGVEEPSQLALLREAGCEAIQGWLVARAMPQREFLRLVSRWTDGMGPATRPAAAGRGTPTAAGQLA